MSLAGSGSSSQFQERGVGEHLADVLIGYAAVTTPMALLRHSTRLTASVSA